MLSMQESEGLSKLTEYLNQTRKQAAMSIDVLNSQIAELRAESDYNRQLIEELRADRDHYKQLGEQLRYESTTKHKLQERDDWKTLIDNMQKDRTRLSEECIQLRSQLQSATYEISLLHDEMNERRERESSIDKESTSSSPSSSSKAHRSPSTPTNGVDLRSMTQSHSYDSSAADSDSGPFLECRLPSSSSRQLKVELKKVQLEVGQCVANSTAALAFVTYSSTMRCITAGGRALQDRSREDASPRRGQATETRNRGSERCSAVFSRD